MINRRDLAASFDSWAEKWFRWLRWLLIAATLSALAEKAGSIVLKIPALISATIVLFYGFFALERIWVAVLPSPARLTKWLVHALGGLIALSQLALMYFIAKVIETVLR